MRSRISKSSCLHCVKQLFIRIPATYMIRTCKLRIYLAYTHFSSLFSPCMDTYASYKDPYALFPQAKSSLCVADAKSEPRCPFEKLIINRVSQKKSHSHRWSILFVSIGIPTVTSPQGARGLLAAGVRLCERLICEMARSAGCESSRFCNIK